MTCGKMKKNYRGYNPCVQFIFFAVSVCVVSGTFRDKADVWSVGPSSEQSSSDERLTLETSAFPNLKLESMLAMIITVHSNTQLTTEKSSWISALLFAFRPRCCTEMFLGREDTVVKDSTFKGGITGAVVLFYYFLKSLCNS